MAEITGVATSVVATCTAEGGVVSETVNWLSFDISKLQKFIFKKETKHLLLQTVREHDT